MRWNARGNQRIRDAYNTRRDTLNKQYASDVNSVYGNYTKNMTNLGVADMATERAKINADSRETAAKTPRVTIAKGGHNNTNTVTHVREGGYHNETNVTGLPNGNNGNNGKKKKPQLKVK